MLLSRWTQIGTCPSSALKLYKSHFDGDEIAQATVISDGGEPTQNAIPFIDTMHFYAFIDPI